MMRNWILGLLAAVIAAGIAHADSPIGTIGGDDTPPFEETPDVSAPPPVLDENCVVSILNQVAQVRADGTWILQNVPANFGMLRARATCVVDGVTHAGQSDPFSVQANGQVSIGDISFDDLAPVPASLSLAASTNELTEIFRTVQIEVRTLFPDGSEVDVTADPLTSYVSSSAAVASVDGSGLVTAAASGRVLIIVRHEAVTAFIDFLVVLSGEDTDGDGIPDDVELANGLDPNDPVDAFEDFDGDGLANGEELLSFGSDPNNPDTDGDGLSDGEEVAPGDDGFVTNPLAPDTDGDGVRDGLEVATGSDPTDPSSFNLAAVLDTLTVSPSAFALTVNTIIGEASEPLSVTGVLIDGTALDLTSTSTGTNYASSDLGICNFGAESGRVFAGADGACTITVSNSGFETTADGTVQTFAPVALSFVAFAGSAGGVDVSGNVAYVAAGSAGLQIVDVGDRSAPVLVGGVPTAGEAKEVKVVGNRAYLADGSEGLAIFSLDNPLAPVLLGSVDTPGDAQDVVVRGDLALVADGASGVAIIDVTNASEPLLLGSTSTAGSARGVDFSADQTFAVVAVGTAGLSIVDIADPMLAGEVATVSTGGDARDVAVQGDFAFVADVANSLVSVDIADPTDPVFRAATPRATGGLLLDVAVAGRFAIGADIFFVNGVPIVDVLTPAVPIPRAILDFSAFRDDNGRGIAVDASHVYLSADVGSSSRLYIGQILALEDRAMAAPELAIVQPAEGATVFEGASLRVEVSAQDDVAVASVGLLVDGAPAGSDTTEPYQFTVLIPTGVNSLTLGATALDLGDNVGTAVDVVLDVIPDPLTTVVGIVLGPGGVAVDGADVVCLGVSVLSEPDGSFEILGLPTISGRIRCTATFLDAVGLLQTTAAAAVSPVPGGITDVGLLTDAAVAESHFDVDAEGWTAISNNSQPFFVAAGGDPEGHICVTDNRGGIVVLYSAPAAFLGDASRAFGQALRLSMRRNPSGGSAFASPFVILRGNGLSLSVVQPDPVDDWSSYLLALDERGGWTVDGDGRAATDAEIFSVLSALDQLLVRAEFRDVLSERSCLDTVILGFVLDPSTAFPEPVALQNGTATFSQLIGGGSYTPEEAIDGSFASVNGWAVATSGTAGGAAAQTAVWETTADLSTDELAITMHFLHDNGGHLIGRFRFSVTTDDRSAFADGLHTGGDVTANWTVLTGANVMGPDGMTFTVLGDESILAGGLTADQGVYTVRYSTLPDNITGLRLEVIEDPSLPGGNGPGLFPANGNFALTEMTLDAFATP
jgi:hypothetical protein